MRRLFWGAVVAVMVAANGMTAAAATLQEHYAEYNKLVGDRQYYAALPHAMIVYKQSKESLGPDHFQTGVMAANVAFIYWATGDTSRAVAKYEEAYRVLTLPANADKGRQFLGTILANLSGAYTDRGEYEKAAPLYQRLLDITGGTDPGSIKARVQALLGAARNQRFLSLDRAVAFGTEARELATKLHGKESNEALESRLVLGEIYMAYGKYDQADRLLNSVVTRKNRLIKQAAVQDLAFIAYLQGNSDGVLRQLSRGGLGNANTNPRGFVAPRTIDCVAGTEGVKDPWVYVAYNVTEKGDVIEPQVIAADPPRVQDVAVLKALSQIKQSSLRFRGETYPRLGMRLLIHCLHRDSEAEVEETDTGFGQISRNAVRLQFARVETPASMAEERAAYIKQVLDGKFDEVIDHLEGRIEGLLSNDREQSEEGAVLTHDLALTMTASPKPLHVAQVAEHALALARELYGKDDAKKTFPYLLFVSMIRGDDNLARDAVKLAKRAFGFESPEEAAALTASEALSTWGRNEDAWDRAANILRNSKEVSPETQAEFLYSYGHALLAYKRESEVDKGRDLLTEMIEGPGRFLAPGNRFLRAAHYALQQYYGTRGDMETAVEHGREANMGSPGDIEGLIDVMPVKRAAPYYPKNALYKALHGFVVLAFTVRADGGVSDMKPVISWPPGVFESSTIDAVKQFQYVPYFNEGVAVDAHHIFFRMTYMLGPY